MQDSKNAQQAPNARANSALGADLAALAAQPTSEKRLELLRRITDAFVEQGDRASAAEHYLFNEVVTKLFNKFAAERRPAAAERLATMAKLPDELACRLANDADIAVARPIIRDYRGMPERILLDISRKGSQAHLTAIAGRKVVTPPVSDIVVARGDRGAIRTLAANSGAQFSDAGMQRLIDKSAGDGDLQALIVERADLSLGAIGKLLPLISDELANRLRDVAVDVDDKVVERHVAEWAAERQKNSSRTDAFIDGIRAGDLNPNDVIGELVAGKRLLDAATVLGALLELERFYTFNLMTEGKIHSALLLLRSIELSWKVADAFIKLRVAKAGLYDYETPPTQADYEAIDVAAAQRVIRFMKVRRATKAE